MGTEVSRETPRRVCTHTCRDDVQVRDGKRGGTFVGRESVRSPDPVVCD